MSSPRSSMSNGRSEEIQGEQTQLLPRVPRAMRVSDENQQESSAWTLGLKEYNQNNA